MKHKVDVKEIKGSEFRVDGVEWCSYVPVSELRDMEYRVERIDGSLPYEVQRLWNTGEWVGCYKAETFQEANNWILEREEKNKQNRINYQAIEEQFGG